MEKFQNSSKINYSFSLFLLALPLVFNGIISYNESSSAIRNKISTYSKQIVGQVKVNIESQLTKYTGYSEEIVFSDLVQNSMANFQNLTPYDKLMINNDLVKSFNGKIGASNVISGIAIITDKNEKVATGLALNDDTIQELGEIFQMKKRSCYIGL